MRACGTEWREDTQTTIGRTQAGRDRKGQGTTQKEQNAEIKRQSETKRDRKIYIKKDFKRIEWNRIKVTGHETKATTDKTN